MVIGVGLEDEDYIQFLNEQRQYDNGPIDPLYKIFLEHLQKDGKSYVFNMVNGDSGLPVRVKYEEENGLSRNMDLGSQTSSCITSFEGRENCVPKSLKRRRSYRESDKVAELAPVPCNQSESPPVVDDDYMKFLSHLKFNNSHSMVLECDSLNITYEEQSETPESLVTEELGIVPYTTSKLIDLTVIEEEDNSSIANFESNEFWRELTANISRPYDQAEYEELWKEASERKPLERMKHLRYLTISYATNEDGLSYLDHYPELAKQIWATNDRHRRLIFLRGLFFWLKNLCHEGAFMPWTSPSFETIAGLNLS